MSDIALLIVEEEVIAIELTIAGPAGPRGVAGTDGVGVPTGGTVGQVLTKQSSADFDADWEDATGGGGSTSAATSSSLGTVEISGTPTDAAHPVAYVKEQVDVLIAAEVAARTTADSTEATARASADSSEASTRAAADTALASSIASEASSRASADSALSSSITSEATARAAADTTLQSNITAEASSRASADTSEATARASADTTLQTNIDAEASARIAADAGKQPLDAELTAIAALTSAADKGIQFTGAGAAGTFDLTAAGRALIDDANAAAQRTTLGLAIGTDVEAHDATLTALAALDATAGLLEQTGADAFTKRALGVGASTSVPTRGDADGRYQPLDAELTALAGLTSAADALAYFTGSGTAAIATFTAVARTLLAAATVAAQRVALGLVIGTDVQAYDAELAALAGLVSAADKLPYFTGSGTAALADLTSAARTLLAAANAATQRSALGLVIGTDVQAYDAELAALAGLASAADKLPYFSGSGTAALADFTTAARALLDDTSASAMLTTLGAIAKAIGTAKGDVISFSASGVPSNLAVGADGSALAADSGASLGLSYQMAARQLITTGQTAWYTTQRVTTTTATPSTGEVYAVPIIIAKAITFVRIAVEVTAAATAGGLARLGIYADDGNGMPGALVLDAGTVATDGATGAKEITISQALGPGVYWLVVNPTVASATFRGSNNAYMLMLPVNTGASYAPNTNTNCWKRISVTGGLPNPFGGSPTVAANAPLVGLKAP